MVAKWLNIPGIATPFTSTAITHRGIVDRRQLSNSHGAWLPAHSTLLKFDLLHVGARDDYQAYITTIPIDRRRRVP